MAELDHFEGGYDRKKVQVQLLEDPNFKTLFAWVYIQSTFKEPAEDMHHETTGDYMNYVNKVCESEIREQILQYKE